MVACSAARHSRALCGRAPKMTANITSDLSDAFSLRSFRFAPLRCLIGEFNIH
jgi:hypothetical protein